MTNIYISYFPKDNDYLENLLVHLKVLRKIMQDVKVWTDKKVLGGDETAQVKLKAFKKADIILLMISSNYLACDKSCGEEMEKSLAYAAKGKKIVIPVLVRSSLWKYSALAKLFTLPGNHIPVNSKVWNNEDEPYLEIVEGLRNIILELRGELTEVAEAIKEETIEEEIAPRKIMDLGKWVHSLQVAAVAAVTVLSFSMIFTNASHPNDPDFNKGDLEPPIRKTEIAPENQEEQNSHIYKPGLVGMNFGNPLPVSGIDMEPSDGENDGVFYTEPVNHSNPIFFPLLGSGHIKSISTSTLMQTLDGAAQSGNFSTFPRKDFPVAGTERPKNPNSPWTLPDVYNKVGTLQEPIGDIEEADRDLV